MIFGIVYLQYGPGMSLQREFLIFPFLLASLLVFPLNNLSGKPWPVIVSHFSWIGCHHQTAGRNIVYRPGLCHSVFNFGEKAEFLKNVASS